MAKKIAIGIIHGIGDKKKDFAEEITKQLKKSFKKAAKLRKIHATSEDLIFEPIHWSPLVEKLEMELWEKVNADQLNWDLLRKFVVSYLGDAIAYQAPYKWSEHARQEIIYNNLHDYIRSALKKLANKAGDTAPLCILAHSLGSVITSNFFYDLQNNNQYAHMNSDMTPLEKGDTFSLFYTLGSPLSLWSMRYTDFGDPIMIPSPQLKNYHPDIAGEWVNFYDKDDVLAYPLKKLNKKYEQMVTRDQKVNSGNFLIRATPFSHVYYWKSQKVMNQIADSLVDVWIKINQ